MLACVLLAFLLVSSAFGFGTQSVGVKGVLLCGDRPLANTKVKLYDDDSEPPIQQRPGNPEDPDHAACELAPDFQKLPASYRNTIGRHNATSVTRREKWGPDLDDLLAEGTTDSLGHFLLHGYTSEMTTIDGKLNIYHDCDDGIKPCQHEYVAEGQIPHKFFDIGTVNMQIKFEEESRDCLHRK